MRTATAIVLAVLVTTSGLAAVAGVGASSGTVAQSLTQDQGTESDGNQSGDADAYAGTHVSFEATGNAITDYRVGDAQLFDRVAVESKSSHNDRAGIGSDVALEAVTNLEGLGLSLGVETETRAEIQTDGAASLSAHDTERGILTVDAGGEGQYVEVGLASETNASVEGDGDRVIVDRRGDENDSDGESENRTGAFVVVGDGTVTVNDDGDVSADLEGESTLVFRSYAEGERDDDARAQEDMIANATATAEVYAEERAGEFVLDVATYGEDVAVNATEQTDARLEMTVERAEHEGTVVITTVSDAVLEAADEAEQAAVTVDGEAAVEASSYSELEGAIGSDESRYTIVQNGEASATADVLVAVNHFSERTVAIGAADSGENETGDDGDDNDEMPGFGIAGAIVALLIGATARLRG